MSTRNSGRLDISKVGGQLEVDLHRHPVGCEKNPGHLKFVPVDQFNVDHLPPGYRDLDLVDIVKALSDLTVRVSVKYISENRHEIVPGTDRPYPFYTSRGSLKMRVGTAKVYRVYKFPDKYNREVTACECVECLRSPTPKMQFGHILISTTAHVVYDNLEAADTTCHFFFDRSGTPNACEGVFALSGMSVLRSDVMADFCIMKYVTHDLRLVDRLDRMVTYFAELENSYAYKCLISTSNKEKKSPDVESDPDTKRPLIIIVSHPHGCSKQVSVGHCVNIDEVGNGWTKYIYTTATCPGSSGAITHKLAHNCTKFEANHSHSYSCAEFNSSSYGIG